MNKKYEVDEIEEIIWKLTKLKDELGMDENNFKKNYTNENVRSIKLEIIKLNGMLSEARSSLNKILNDEYKQTEKEEGIKNLFNEHQSLYNEIDGYCYEELSRIVCFMREIIHYYMKDEIYANKINIIKENGQIDEGYFFASEKAFSKLEKSNKKDNSEYLAFNYTEESLKSVSDWEFVSYFNLSKHCDGDILKILELFENRYNFNFYELKNTIYGYSGFNNVINELFKRIVYYKMVNKLDRVPDEFLNKLIKEVKKENSVFRRVKNWIRTH